ncbi:unnamed protein product [Effrenium voratum]|nr:unnamed protein product [Effrenium voratum]
MDALRGAVILARHAFQDTRGPRAVAWSVAVFLLLLAEVATAGHYSVVQKHLITALQAKNAPVFKKSLWQVGGIILFISPIIALREYAAGMLGMNWRTSLTTRLARRYLTPPKGSERHPYYALTLTGEIDNPDQRICQDVGHFVNSAVSFTQDMIRTTLSVLTFAPVLYSISPTACLGGIAYAVTGTLVSARGFGIWLGFYKMQSLQQEATLRYKLIRVRENAESIAFFDGGEAEWSKFKTSFDSLLQTLQKTVMVAVGYGMLNRSFQWATFAVTPLLVGPAYLEGKVEYGVIAQATMAFNIILEACTLVMQRLESLSDISVRIRRLAALDQALEPTQREPGISRRQAHMLRFQGVSLQTPRSDVCQVLFENVSFEVPEGQSLLVVGESGIGKSSLLRAAAGLWVKGCGTIELCDRHSVFFMPQKPYMFLGSLKEQLLYPHADDVRPDADVEEALRQVHLQDLLDRHNLSDTKDWASLLSLGQQQRINFARVLLRPSIQFALMDECTSACDPENEMLLYQLLRQRLRSYVSVGHRPSLQNFHSHALWLRRSAFGPAEVTMHSMVEYQMMKKSIQQLSAMIDNLIV